jgi:hypothetical protein
MMWRMFENSGRGRMDVRTDTLNLAHSQSDRKSIPVEGSTDEEPPMWHKLLMVCALAGAAFAYDNLAQAAGLQASGIVPRASPEQFELAFWNSIKDSAHASDYEAYLKAYPKGRFAALAQARLQRLRSAPAAAAATAPAPPPATASHPKARTTPVKPPTPAPAPTPSSAAPAPAVAGGGPELRDCPGCPVLVSLPADTFTMGNNASDPSEKPAHPVRLGGPFAIGKFEVTVQQWKACVDAGACP